MWHGEGRWASAHRNDSFLSRRRPRRWPWACDRGDAGVRGGGLLGGAPVQALRPRPGRADRVLRRGRRGRGLASAAQPHGLGADRRHVFLLPRRPGRLVCLPRLSAARRSAAAGLAGRAGGPVLGPRHRAGRAGHHAVPGRADALASWWKPMLWAYLALGALWLGGAFAISLDAVISHHVSIDSSGGLTSLDNPGGSTPGGVRYRRSSSPRWRCAGWYGSPGRC